MKVILNITEKAPPTVDSYNKEERQLDVLSKDFHKFVKACLKRDPMKRPRALDLLKDNFIKKAKNHQYVYNRVLCSLPQIKPTVEDLPKALRRSFDQSERPGMSTTSWNFSFEPLTSSSKQLKMAIIQESKVLSPIKQAAKPAVV